MAATFTVESISASHQGAGPPLILLHSLLSDRDSFAEIRERLAETHRVIVVDLPGFGGSPAMAGGLSAVSDRVAAFARAASPDDRPIVVGNGYGGFVALQMAIRHPGLLSRLALVGSGATFDPQGRAAFRTMAAIAAEKGLAAVADIAMRRLFAPAYQAAEPDLMDERRASFLRTRPAVFITACKALAELDLRDQLAEVAIPVLVMVGEIDEATPPAMSRELVAALPDASLIVLPGCAHTPQLQEPGRFVDALRPFL